MITLALDTALTGFSVALIENEKMLASVSEYHPKMQSAVLLKKMDELLTNANKTLGDIDRVLYGNGPGSFTSLRIGLATLMGLFALSSPSVLLLSCSSLLLRVLSMQKSNEGVCCYLSAGRDRVYCGEWQFNKFHEEVIALTDITARKAVPAPGLVDPEVFLKILKTPAYYQVQSLEKARLNYLLDPDIG